MKNLWIVLLLVLSISSEIFAKTSDQEKDGLVALYDSTNGDNWTNSWNTDDGPCNDIEPWYGVTCNDQDEIVALDLEENNLVGTIPDGIENVLNLVTLNLSKNSLSGSIPASIGNPDENAGLDLLDSLNLSNNSLTGKIPKELGNLAELTLIQLDGNQLIGSIPKELGQLTKLKYLYLWVNQLSGEIPSEIGDISSLVNVDFSENNLTGEIPSTFGNLSALRELKLNDNMLGGEIPQEITNLTLENETSLNLSTNCSLNSSNSDVQNFIVNNSAVDSYDPEFLETQGVCITQIMK